MMTSVAAGLCIRCAAFIYVCIFHLYFFFSRFHFHLCFLWFLSRFRSYFFASSCTGNRSACRLRCPLASAHFFKPALYRYYYYPYMVLLTIPLLTTFNEIWCRCVNLPSFLLVRGVCIPVNPVVQALAPLQDSLGLTLNDERRHSSTTLNFEEALVESCPLSFTPYFL